MHLKFKFTWMFGTFICYYLVIIVVAYPGQQGMCGDCFAESAGEMGVGNQWLLTQRMEQYMY